MDTDNRVILTNHPLKPEIRNLKSPAFSLIQMDEQWYILIGDRKKAGPVSFEKLLELKNKGKIAPNTMLRRTEDKKWVAAAQVSGLFGTLLSESNAELPILNIPPDFPHPDDDYPSEITEVASDPSETAFIHSSELLGQPEADKIEVPAINIMVTPRPRSGKSKKSAPAQSTEPTAPDAAQIYDGPLEYEDAPLATDADHEQSYQHSGRSTRTKGNTKYPALLTISFLLKILAVIYVVFGLLVTAGMTIAGMAGGSAVGEGDGGAMFGGMFMGLVSGGICLCGTLFAALILWATSELIRLMMDIEENTRN